MSSTIEVPSGTSFLGGGGRGSDQFQVGPEGASIWAGGYDGPVFRARKAQKISFENLVIIGSTNGVTVSDGALVRIANCAIHAQVLICSENHFLKEQLVL